MEAVAIFGYALSQSRHTEFWEFSTAKPELYPQIRKKIKRKFELKISYLQKKLPAAPLDLGSNSVINDVFLLYFCDMILPGWICSVSNNVKKSIVTCVYQLCLLAFTKFVSLRRLGFTMQRGNYFSIQDCVRIH